MDMSVIEGEEKPLNVNEVPEYSAEIHKYLREMEVRKPLFFPKRFNLWVAY